MRKFLTVLLMCAAGCASSLQHKITSVLNAYERIDYADGVTWEEAKLIAQRALIRQGLTDRYDFDRLKALRDIEDLPHHADHWFITFHERTFSTMAYVFLVIIEKDSGKVKFEDDIKDDKRWIIEAALLK